MTLTTTERLDRLEKLMGLDQETPPVDKKKLARQARIYETKLDIVKKAAKRK